MASKKLHSPEQPLPVRLALQLYEFSASLKLAVVLIFGCALALAWATFVESEYGTPAVAHGVYGSWWFALLNLLLAINIFSAAAIRYPWKRYQTGFVITHLGLLVLLFGCLVSRRGAIDAQMPIFEDDIGYRAYTDAHNIELTVHPMAAPGESTEVQVISIPFKPGPFNWNSYEELFYPVKAAHSDDQDRSWYDQFSGSVAMGMKNLLRYSSGIAFSMVGRSEGVLYDQDGIKVEVLDYYADSEQVDAPMVRLKLSMPRGMNMGPHGKPEAGDLTWVPVMLRVFGQPLIDYPFGMGTGRDQGGGRMTFRLAGSAAEQAAFLASKPAGEVTGQGQIILYADGKPYDFSVDELLEKQQAGEKLPLGDTGLELELAQHLEEGTLDGANPTTPLKLIASGGDGLAGGPAVELTLHRGEDSTARLILFARHPEFNIYDHAGEVYGTYWFNPGELTSAERMQGMAGSRIDFLQGADEKLYYRYWSGQEIVALEEMPTDGATVDAFKMPIAQLEMFVEQFVPSKTPRKVDLPRPFSRERPMTQKRPAAQLRITVDGKPREFWLAGMPVIAFERPPMEGERALVPGDKRTVTVTLPPQDIFKDVGFQVRLKQFQRKLDPGTSQAAHYGSTIDILTRDLSDTTAADETPEVLMSDVEISMNAPVDIVDPATGRTLRLFQESFQGPWKPGEQIYEQFANKAQGRELFYSSVLTVNYDPGRGIKYAGCWLIVLGIFTMFYMRAYFFKPVARKVKSETSSPTVETTSVTA